MRAGRRLSPPLPGDLLRRQLHSLWRGNLSLRVLLPCPTGVAPFLQALLASALFPFPPAGPCVLPETAAMLTKAKPNPDPSVPRLSVQAWGPLEAAPFLSPMNKSLSVKLLHRGRLGSVARARVGGRLLFLTLVSHQEMFHVLLILILLRTPRSHYQLSHVLVQSTNSEHLKDDLLEVSPPRGGRTHNLLLHPLLTCCLQRGDRLSLATPACVDLLLRGRAASPPIPSWAGWSTGGTPAASSAPPGVSPGGEAASQANLTPLNFNLSTFERSFLFH